MKNITVFVLCIFSFQAAFAQEVREYLINRYFEVTQDEKEAFFIRLAQPYEGFWAYTDYDSKQRIVQTGFFTDSTFNTRIGPHTFSWEGKLMYKGNYVNGIPSGFWYFFDKKGVLYDSLHYVVKNTEKTTFPSGASDEEEKKKTILLQEEHLKKDTSITFVSVDIESVFPGGEKAWAKHLIKQLSLPDLVMATNKPQKLTTEVQFVVCRDGEICSVEAINSSHPLLDMMAINAIRKGPRWEPASQNGRHVKAWRRQKISFIISE
jgi:hypothetical protein